MPLNAVATLKPTVGPLAINHLGQLAAVTISFDLKPGVDSTEPIDLRLYLAVHGEPLTETWQYQWTPPPVAERRF